MPSAGAAVGAGVADAAAELPADSLTTGWGLAGAQLTATGDDLLYVTVEVEDRDGNRVPTDTRMVSFRVEGAGAFEATANGDPTCTMSFQAPRMKLFSGAATAIVRSARTPGTVTFTASAPGVQSASMEIPVVGE